MEYNTNRLKLIIPEYGRNIHKMISYAIKIKDRDKRNRCALGIIKLMTDFVLNHRLRKSIPFFQQKLWNQLMIMSQHKLDIDLPFPKKESEKFKSFEKKITYPESLNNFRHYGKIIRNMIHVAIQCKDRKKKEGLFYAIANTMKKNYLRWNKSLVEDDTIFNDLKKLSKGKICLKYNGKKPYPLLQYSKIKKYRNDGDIQNQRRDSFKRGHFSSRSKK
ncbi:DUF4290 domain-containing protein [Blattabacterium cuenoti]|uniref:DUF4290 domain-containing protein n=1 Tax=Blattabacterium cuenoti TaxID=1653831 RepID=UPI00163C3C54|nr:DUF4290 domain-containing protein [Blattabacterium cuenoti]